MKEWHDNLSNWTINKNFQFSGSFCLIYHLQQERCHSDFLTILASGPKLGHEWGNSQSTIKRQKCQPCFMIHYFCATKTCNFSRQNFHTLSHFSRQNFQKKGIYLTIKVYMKWNFPQWFYWPLWKCVWRQNDHCLPFVNNWSRSKVIKVWSF